MREIGITKIIVRTAFLSSGEAALETAARLLKGRLGVSVIIGLLLRQYPRTGSSNL